LRAELDTEVERFRTCKLDEACPYVWVDATFLKVRQGHRVVNMAVVIAVGLNAATGQREVLGVDIGPSEDGARGLVSRGLAGVQLVISDSDQGPKSATPRCSKAPVGRDAARIMLTSGLCRHRAGLQFRFTNFVGIISVILDQPDRSRSATR